MLQLKEMIFTKDPTQELGLSDNMLTLAAARDSGWIVRKGSLYTKEPHQTGFLLTEYLYKGVKYLQFSSTTSGFFCGGPYYLGVSINGYLGVYGWSGASGFAIWNDQLFSKAKMALIGYTAEGYIRAGGAMTPLCVKQQINPEVYQYLLGF